MASNLEIRTGQRDKLYVLLKLRAVNKNIEVKELNEAINAAEATMDEEDVAWVEKKIAQMYNK